MRKTIAGFHRTESTEFCSQKTIVPLSSSMNTLFHERDSVNSLA